MQQKMVLNLRCVKSNLNSRRYFFAYRTVKAWNKLNSTTVCATSINIFKSKLAQENFTSVLKTDLSPIKFYKVF